MDGWMDGYMDGYMDGWIDTWMDTWVDTWMGDMSCYMKMKYSSRESATGVTHMRTER